MPSCAYCGSDRAATREHIWPGALIAKYEGLLAYNPNTNKLHLGEPVVKDVCADCNNGPLSGLDRYLCRLFDEHFYKIISAGEAASFEYDYIQLLRSLLKISYNASRGTTNSPVQKLHRQFANFILKGGHHPKVMLRLQIVTTATMVTADTNEEKVIRPAMMRCGILAYDGPMSKRFLVRMIAINSFWFYMIIPYKPEPEHKWKAVVEGLEVWKTPPGVLVLPTSSSMKIPVAKTTFMHPLLMGTMLYAERA